MRCDHVIVNPTSEIKLENEPKLPQTLLHCLVSPPPSPLENSIVLSTQLSTLLFASLLRSSFRCKEIARSIVPSAVVTLGSPQNGSQEPSFFVPAQGVPSAPPASVEANEDDDEPPPNLLGILSEHLSLAFLSRTHAATSETERDTREWDRLLVAYLALLSQWLWESPKAVREFLENGGMGMVRNCSYCHVTCHSETDVLSIYDSTRS